LNVLQDIKDKYRVPVGFSDHTIGFAAPFAAAALGASIIEKHFTLSTLMYGSDAKHSMEPDQFSEMVAGIRQIESMLCNPVNKDVVTNNISEMKYVFEKSVVTTVKIPKGSFIKKEMVDVKKPGSGIQAKYLKNIIGAVALSDLPANHIVQVDEIRGFVK
jgi:N-acetylneuraminate synthase